MAVAHPEVGEKSAPRGRVRMLLTSLVQVGRLVRSRKLMSSKAVVWPVRTWELMLLKALLRPVRP